MTTFIKSTDFIFAPKEFALNQPFCGRIQGIFEITKLEQKQGFRKEVI